MLRVTKFSFIVLLFFLAKSASAYDRFPTVELSLNDKRYTLELADNAARKSQGLMYRRYLPRDKGMLFVYDQPTDLKIWMKNTFIPLAVIWLDEQAVVIDKKVLFPCRSKGCPSFGPDQPSRYVLELNASEFGLFKKGDRLSAVREWHSSL